MAEFAGIKLTWEDVNDFEDGFVVYRDSSPFDKSTLPAEYATVPADAVSYIDTDVNLGETYYYMLSTYVNKNGSKKEMFNPLCLEVTATLTPGEIGDFFEGGYYAGDIVLNETYGADQGTYALLLAPPADFASVLWKNVATITPNCADLNNGLANSYAAIQANSSSAPIVSHPAIEYCVNYTGGGFTDWYLPAQNEFSLIIGNRELLPHSFTSDSINYWSSTQKSATTIACFNRGTSFNTKNPMYVQRALPVRRIKIA